MAFLAVLFACFSSGCAESHAPAAESNSYKIVCTVGMIADIVRQVAGDRAVVENLIGEGVDPHLYKPTRSDVAALREADLIFYGGLMLEGKMTDTFVSLARSRPVHAVTELIEEDYLMEPDEFEGRHDPHVWMDVRGWMRAVEAVAGALGEYDPGNADEYAANAARYREDLERLDAYVRDAIASIPERHRVLVTAHDAFNYFGRAYGIQVMGIQGISTESEAGLDDINRLVDLIVSLEVPALFVETSVSEKNVKAIIEGARSRGREVRIGGSLFSDAMGPAGTYEGTYIGMIDHNATTIARALGGQAPEGGMQGKLASAKP